MRNERVQPTGAAADTWRLADGGSHTSPDLVIRETKPRRNYHVRDRGQGWEADFPLREEVEDYAGRTRSFAINCHEGGLGFTVRAEEEGRRDAGYEFAAFRTHSSDAEAATAAAHPHV